MTLVLALGGLGVGYAHWTETLQVEGDISTGYIDVNFASQYDNDSLSVGELSMDPTEAGSWCFVNNDVVWTGNRIDKNVASTTSSHGTWDGNAIPVNTSGNWAKITVANGYPSYWGSTAWDVKNNGNVPVELWTVTLVQVSHGLTEIPKDMALDIGTRYYVNADTGRVNTSLQAGDDFSFILSAHELTQLDPWGWDGTDTLWNTIGYLDVTVHIEQDAQQKYSYDFLIDYLFANWNEVP